MPAPTRAPGSHSRDITLMGRPTTANQCRQIAPASVIRPPATAECTRAQGHVGSHGNGKLGVQWPPRVVPPPPGRRI